ncbi:HAMP domain-containing histidine kinase [Criibacterium bergeronii]|uniref:histidine kinase n=1 Tax=Criibacterium bergeronii TaxID=1871336 RepID=A0A552V3J8_9FIRM|nr:HAMP domain-containing sensor histidine kinase [Criibacterium bergeronii]TRW25043.1 HAMP domain-containing histidine kinase [Criibacterium bergeronii]
MKKTLSLQWKLTLTTALLVIIVCLTLSYSISKTAILYMDEIENSVIAVFPEEIFKNPSSENIELNIDPSENISEKIKDTQSGFWGKSLLITAIITCISSIIVYFLVGYFLKPLKKFNKQLQNIQVKNLQEPIPLTSNSVEIVKITDTFNEMLKRINDAFSAQKQFSANAAHELRTPIAVMQTQIEVLKKNYNSDISDYKDVTNMVATQTERLSQVIDILLEMTQLQTAEKKDMISLYELIEEVICDLSAVAEQKNVEIIQKSGDAKLLGNEMLIYRAIYNLIENAIKYNIEGGNVSVEIEEDEKYAKVIVIDTGKGIDKNNWKQIFEPFFRVDKSRSRSMGGAGLGLALVKEIALRHAGDVCVVNSNNNGTKIELKLFKR